MSKNLIIEHSLFEGKIKEDQNGKFLVKGVLQRADAANQNNRIYPMHILQRESKKYETLIKERRALGELDHPESTVINLKNVSHNIVEMYWEDKDLCGVVEVLSTPAGNILKELFKHNIRLGISSRGLGSVKPNRDETVMVQEDFELPPCKFYVIWDKEIPDGMSFADCEMCWTSLNTFKALTPPYELYPFELLKIKKLQLQD